LTRADLGFAVECFKVRRDPEFVELGDGREVGLFCLVAFGGGVSLGD